MREKKHLKNDRYFINSEKSEQIIAEYSTIDGRLVVVKQTMIYENKNKKNRIKWHYFINGEFDSIHNLDMRLFFSEELDAYLSFY